MGRRRILRGALGAVALAGLMFGASGGIQALQTVPAGNLVLHLPLDVTTSPTPDVAGVANNATFVGTPAAAVGVFGSGLSFNGTDQSLSVPAEASLDVGTGSYSVAMWIKPSNVANHKRMFNKWNTAGNGKGILFDINAGVGGGDVAGNLRFRLSDGTNNLDYVQQAGFQANQWYHIAGTVDRTAAPGTLRIFVNGIQLGTTQNLPAGMGDISVVDEIQIGELNAANFYGGLLDEVLFYTRALSTSDIETLYFGGNMSIAAGRPAPVVAQHGLLAKYYNDSTPIANTMTPPGSPIATVSATATLALTRLDTTVNFAWAQGSPATGININDFFGVWTGKVKTPGVAGNYQFGTSSDDGVRLWVNNVLVRDDWVDQGAATNPEMSADQNLAADTFYDIRLEMYERAGDAAMKLYWLIPGGAAEIISPVFLYPPNGPAAPTNLTATATANSITPQVVVTWTAPAGNPAATSYIVSRATAPGGPFTQVTATTATTFTDTTVAFGTAYYYTVQPTAEGGILVGTPTAASTPGATPIQPAMSATPTSGLITSEAGLNDTITLTVNISPVGGPGNVQITSSAPAEALVSTATSPTPAPAITLVIPQNTAVGTTYTVTVHGQNDFVADGPVNYNITFVVTGPVTATNEWNTTGIAPVSGTNSDNDTPGITVTQLSGPTSEGGGTATFIVVFDTQPSVATTMSVISSNTGEAVVSSGSLTFNTNVSPDPNGWNTNHVVTVTGVDDNALDFTQPFTISLSVTGGDPVYTAMTAGGPIVRSGINLDNETIPTLDPVWGGGGGGGCGLLGLEAILALVLLRLRRRAT